MLLAPRATVGSKEGNEENLIAESATRCRQAWSTSPFEIAPNINSKISTTTTGPASPLGP